MTFFKKLMIFGGAGSLGHALLDYYKDQDLMEIVVVSRDEAKHWEVKNKYRNSNAKIRTVICDVRDDRRVRQVIQQENPEGIIIAQALKQVDTCEEQPSESIDTNILGVRNILDQIRENSISRHNKISTVCFVSTDKACNPINVYGMCKSISERMVFAAAKENTKVRYVVTRYGNVISSKGSIVPLFLKQAKEAEAFTVTDGSMTRFMMLLSESVELIDKAMDHGKSGSLWIPKLDSFRVEDLALYFSQKYNKPVKTIGVRPGEKFHEVLMNEVEDAKKQSGYGCFVIEQDAPFTPGHVPEEFSSKDHVVSYEELKSRLDQFLEKDHYVKNLR